MTARRPRRYPSNVLHELDDLKIGKVLERLIRDSGLSYRDLGEELGIPKSTLFNYVQGCLPRSGTHLRKLCRRFNISVEELLFDEPPQSRRCALKKGQIIRGAFMVMEVIENE